jgi:hypothetical protein
MVGQIMIDFDIDAILVNNRKKLVQSSLSNEYWLKNMTHQGKIKIFVCYFIQYREWEDNASPHPIPDETLLSPEGIVIHT